MRLFNPKQETFQSLDEHSRQIMLKTIAFFEDKGKKALKGLNMVTSNYN
ncbi:MAG: hypothetical protein HQK59_07685 [Deltaproteobacteria bacterium]|nr:hypothetical protein [Deltaproteobacteria bacterium]MBF0523976.1 hypothetical protein [Deltaproteobacteria bacterium]